MSDKYRTVLSVEDFSPDECKLIQQLTGQQKDAVLSKAELDSCLHQYLIFQNNYVCAAKKILADLEILELDYRVKYDHRIIRSLDSRIKSVQSICSKLQKKKKPITLESAAKNLTDIAGIRVICPYIEDIYSIKTRLLSQDNIKLLRCSDYIKHPKTSGYRSLHLIISTDLHLGSENISMPVEIQMRTVAMDSWAGLEHKLKYKNPNGVNDEISSQLRQCADAIAETDVKMQEIYRSLFGSQECSD